MAWLDPLNGPSEEKAKPNLPALVVLLLCIMWLPSLSYVEEDKVVQWKGLSFKCIVKSSDK